MNETIRILGLGFFSGTAEEAVAVARQGGLVVAPSGPGLADMPGDAVYRAALEAADVRLLDSGLLAWLWEWRHKRPAPRISGYLFLTHFLQLPDIAASGACLWVAPSPAAAEHTRTWLAKERGLAAPPESWYVAPDYTRDAVADEALLALVRKGRPRFIFICVGGGPQEKLGAWLKARLDYRPTILCTGAAIAFLTGEQAPIPYWADRARLGWLLRILHEPRKFLPRYWQARRLVSLYRRWGEDAPPSVKSGK